LKVFDGTSVGDLEAVHFRVEHLAPARG